MIWNTQTRGRITRRSFLKQLASGGAALLMGPSMFRRALAAPNGARQGLAQVFAAKNGTPGQNVEKVLQMMGGIQNFVSPGDIVILKPNCQWWNQGTTNISAMIRLIEIILDIPGFSGEIIVAENHQKSIPFYRGWTRTNEINGDPLANNMGELIDLFHQRGYDNVTKYHWMNTKEGGVTVSGPEQGDGYVRAEPYYTYESKTTMMTYPVFTSSYSGITIDLKHGAWKDGKYIDRKVVFINTAVLNHHFYGVTSSVKNLMGVVDLPGNESGMLSEDDDLYNFHSLGVYGMGGALGTFLQHVRKPDLNIVTAEWVGWGSRIEVDEAVRPRTILAGLDPVALDYWGARYVLWPNTPEEYIRYSYHDPDRTDRPFNHYLTECARECGGIMDNSEITAHVYDFSQSHVRESRFATGSYALSIGQNFPNPFEHSTRIPVNVREPGPVSILIYNIRGREVRRIADNRNLSYGDHYIEWDGMDKHGKKVSPGAYICRVLSQGESYSITLFRTIY